MLRANLHLTGSVFLEWLQDLHPLRVFGMFLLGAAAADLRLAEAGSGRQTLLRRIAAAALFSGLLLAVAETLVEPESSAERLLYIAAETAAAPLLAAGYAAALILWWQKNSLPAAGMRSALAPAGRMALTNYLMQSAVCVPLFYGFGAGQPAVHWRRHQDTAVRGRANVLHSLRCHDRSVAWFCKEVRKNAWENVCQGPGPCQTSFDQVEIISMAKRNKGSSFDDFLKDEGLFEEVTAVAIKRFIAISDSLDERRRLAQKRPACAE